MKTNRALTHLLFGVHQGLGQGPHLAFWASDQMQGKALSCFWANSGQSLEFFNEFC